MTKSLSRNASRTTRGARFKTTSNRKAKLKRTIQKTPHRTAAKERDRIAAEAVRGTPATLPRDLDPFRHPGPHSFRLLAEENSVTARDLFEGSRNTLQAVLESWHGTFGAAGRSAVALNRKMIDITERNLETSFDFALRLAGARSLPEAMEVQAAYWGNVLGEHAFSSKTPSSRKR